MSRIWRLLTALCAAFALCALCTVAFALSNENPAIPVERIQLSQSEKKLAEKGKWFISATVYPSQASNKALEWTVDDESVASVTSVTAQGAWILAKGKSGARAAVTAKATDGSGVYAKCDIEITAPVSDIMLWSDPSTGIMLVNETLRIYSTVLPSDASGELKWTSSNDEVASITQRYTNGVMITAHDGGEAIITAQAQDGTDNSSSYSVFVKVPIESISLPENADIFIGGALQLEPTLRPSNTTDTTVRWRSDNKNVAYVNGSGLVTAIGEGTTRVMVKSAVDPNISGICLVNVTRPVLFINLTTLHPVIGVGGKTQVIAAIAPYNATTKSVAWSISDESVATVSSTGLVTGVSPGIAVASASALDGSGAVGFIPIEIKGTLESISLPAQTSLYPGESKSLKLSVTPYDMVIEGLKWITTDETKVKVSKDGVLTGVSLGQATIIASAPGGQSAMCSVTVSKAIKDLKIYNKNEEVYASGIFDMYKGDSATFKAIVEPASSDSYIAWSSSDKRVASISDAGVLRAVSAGETRVTASAIDYNTQKTLASKSFKVKVQIPVSSIVMPADIELLAGSSARINAAVKPKQASNRQLTWASSDESVAKVSNGTVTGVSPGKAYILATSKNLVTGVTRVTVAQPVREIELSLPEGIDRVWAGDSFNLLKRVSPADAGEAVIWKSDDKSVATVDSNGKVVARKRGTATITATAADSSGVKGSFKLTVYDAVTNVSFEQALVELFCNSDEDKYRSLTLKPIIKPRSAAKYDVKWTSSDARTVAVDTGGKVTAVSEGVCTITAEVEGVTAGIAAKVMRLPSYIAFDIDEMSLEVGDKVSVATNVSFDGSDTYIAWRSSKKSVATINKNGLIKARGPGNTIISARTRNGLKATFKLRVSK